MNGSFYVTRPDVLLRAEGLAELVALCFVFQHFFPHHWIMFALLFLSPDVSLLPYLRPATKAAAAFYNLMHCDVFPLALGLFAWLQGSMVCGEVALIWLAHISFDRCLGFGLKFADDFRRTHIQSAAGI